jgi:hypothetical protein
MKAPRLALIVIAAAVTLTSVAAAGSAAAKQRVAIDMEIVPESTFVLTSQTAGGLKRDSGTIRGNWRSVLGLGRSFMRDGQRVTIYSGVVWKLTGKRGTLTIRERNEWVDVGNGDGVAIGTWKVVSGTGQYAGIVGKGRSGHAGLGSPWYARYEGFLITP